MVTLGLLLGPTTMPSCASDEGGTRESEPEVAVEPSTTPEPAAVQAEPSAAGLDPRAVGERDDASGPVEAHGSAWHQTVALRERAQQLRLEVDARLAKRRAQQLGVGAEMLRSVDEMQREIDAVDKRLVELQDEMLADPAKAESTAAVPEISDLEVRLFRVRGLVSVVFREAE